jgi:5-methylthioribose kinase
MKFKQDKVLKSRIKAVGDLYLSEGDYLLHGDFYPGSWLQTVKGVRVIDPEFTFYGPREFDLGVWKAHLMLSQHEDHVIDKLHLEYDVFSDLDVPLLNVFAGIESMRRLIGLAQLPLLMEISKKMEFLDKAYQWIKS